MRFYCSSLKKNEQNNRARNLIQIPHPIFSPQSQAWLIPPMLHGHNPPNIPVNLCTRSSSRVGVNVFCSTDEPRLTISITTVFPNFGGTAQGIHSVILLFL